MKKVVKWTLAVAAAATMGAGCNSAWWQALESNPVLQVQTFEQGVQVVLNEAQVAWTADVQPLLPAASAAAITQQFENALFAANHALQVLNDAVATAVTAQTSSPSFTVIETAITDAISQVLAIVNQYETNQPIDAGAILATSKAGTAPVGHASPALADAYSGLAKLKKMAVHGTI
jgi:hypothetical protein